MMRFILDGLEMIVIFLAMFLAVIITPLFVFYLIGVLLQ